MTILVKEKDIEHDPHGSYVTIKFPKKVNVDKVRILKNALIIKLEIG